MGDTDSAWTFGFNPSWRTALNDLHKLARDNRRAEDDPSNVDAIVPYAGSFGWACEKLVRRHSNRIGNTPTSRRTCRHSRCLQLTHADCTWQTYRTPHIHHSHHTPLKPPTWNIECTLHDDTPAPRLRTTRDLSRDVSPTRLRCDHVGCAPTAYSEHHFTLATDWLVLAIRETAHKSMCMCITSSMSGAGRLQA